MLRSRLTVLLLIPGIASADVTDLTLLDEIELAQSPTLQLSEPIVDENGTVYWYAPIVDTENGGDILMSSNGPLASDTFEAAETGDFPLHPYPTDAQSGNVLLQGTHITAGHQNTAAIFQYPGLARIAYYGSEFPGFTSDPVALQIGRPFYANDGSIYFGMRRLISAQNFTYTICHTSGGSIEILAQAGVSAVPGGGGATFTLIVNPTVRGGVVLFYGEGGGRRGVYQLEGGTITTVVDNQTVLPPNVNPIAIGGVAAIAYDNDGHDVAIAYLDGISGGVWKRIGGLWSRVVAGNTAIPGGVGNFFYFAAPAIRDEQVVFLGGRHNQFSPPPQDGIYTDAFGAVVPVVDLATPFGHAAPVAFDVPFGGRWFNGAEISFAVEGNDWREIYRGTPVPEPGPTAAVLTAALLLAIRKRRASLRALLLAVSLPAAAHADYDLTLLQEVRPMSSSPSSALLSPVVGVGGAAFWEEQVVPGFGAKRLVGAPGGILAQDATIPAGAGDFPLAVAPTDAQSGTVLLFGQHGVPAEGGGFLGTVAIFEYPGLARLAYYGTTFPGFTNHPVDLTIEGPLLYDSDGSILFGLRETITIAQFRRAICRLSGGVVSILAETGVTIVPGTGSAFTTIVNARPSGGRVLFYGEGGGRRGVYLLDGGNVETVVDDQTVLPPNSTPALLLDAGDVVFDLDGTDIAVTLKESGGGVWTRIGGQWTRIVARGDPIPNGVGVFFDLLATSIRDGKVAFHGGRNNPFVLPVQWGIYSNANGPLEAVANLETDFGGDIPTGFAVTSFGRFFDGSHVVFAVENGTWRALYRATAVPEPGAAAGALAAVMALALGVRRARRARGDQPSPSPCFATTPRMISLVPPPIDSHRL